MRIRHLIYYSIIILASFNILNGQDILMDAAFDTTCIFIGDQIHYTVTVEQPSDISLKIQAHKDTLIKKIEILSGPKTDSSSISGDRLRITNRYLITSFDTGFYQVPPVYAEIRNESGIKRFYSDYALLKVIRVKIAPQDSSAKIFDIIQPYRAPVTLGEILQWVLLALLVAALVFVIIRLLKRFKKAARPEEVIVNPDPAHVIAFRDLEKLKNEQLWQKGEVKSYYSRLTEILRQYLENRYGVFSLEMTTSETLIELIKTGFKKDDLYTMLKTILNGSDLVKFAKYKPEPSENESHFENSWAFVDKTKVEPDLAGDTSGNDMKEDVS
jgi:large-conductance mechanosensitive channel